MDHFIWSQGHLDHQSNEESVYNQKSVTIYNQEQRTGFTSGQLDLTSHRLIWHSLIDRNCSVETNLSNITSIELRQTQKENETNRFGRLSNVTRLIVNFSPGDGKLTHLSIVDSSLTRSFTQPFVQFEFEYGGHNEFHDQLGRQLEQKRWSSTEKSNQNYPSIGITGIQRNIQNRLDKQDAKINDSFKDLSVLMKQAKEMVTLSNSITTKLNKASADDGNNDDDMNKLKGYFSNMGIIDSPVTKEGSGSKYYKDLAMEISRNFTEIIAKHGGIMTLSDVYCRLNRARAIVGLISPDDLLNSCKQLNKLNQKLKYNVYQDSNLHVLELTDTHNQMVDQIRTMVSSGSDQSLTIYGLSKELSCSIIVARKHLLDAERLGHLCRDETSFGLKFYKNLFLLD